MRLTYALMLASLCCGTVGAQDPADIASLRAARVGSPVVLPDNRVTFRLLAPNATAVLVEGSWGGGKDIPMTKDDTGVWSVTTSAPLPPELWSYTYSVEGVRSLDPGNPNAARGAFGYRNTFIVSGDTPSEVKPRVVPHGTMEQVWVPSSVSHTQRRMEVYLPPGYEDSKARYPVLYLLHGAMEDEETWSTMGVANVIMDNLIFEGKTKPMIVIMPNAYPSHVAALDLGGVKQAPFSNAATGRIDPAVPNYAPDEMEIIGAIVPFVDSHFRTQARPVDRAIAGLSMGGGIVTGVGMKRPDIFANIGVFSTGNFMRAGAPLDAIKEVAPGFLANADATNKNYKIVFFSVGTDDPRRPSTDAVTEQLRKLHINLVYKTYSGIHEWKVWRDSLIDFAPLLFR